MMFYRRTNMKCIEQFICHIISMKVPLLKNHRNISTLVLTDQQTFNQPPFQSNYRSKSQVAKMISDFPEQPSTSQAYTHHNIISQKIKQYSIPRYASTEFLKGNKDYQQFLNEKKKFQKPYDECTKYVDSLNKNKALLRRGQFDLPLTLQISSSSPKSTKFNTIKTDRSDLGRSKMQTTRKSAGVEQFIDERRLSDKCKEFDKTVKHHYQSYRSLLNHGRWQKKQEVKMKNSMNRIIALEMIEQTLKKKNNLQPIKNVHAIKK